jgi:hypothetical protein
VVFSSVGFYIFFGFYILLTDIYCIVTTFSIFLLTKKENSSAG